MRLLVARRDRPRSSTTASAACPPTCARATCSSSTPRRRIPAALPATRADGTAVDLHLSTPVPGAVDGAGGSTAPGYGVEPALRWVVELRRAGARFRSAGAGERLALPAGGSAELLASYLSPGRLWIAALDLPAPLHRYLAEHGRPIAYGHLARPRPLRDLQTVFADEPGSAEMPSAGRPFTQRVLDDLLARGVAGRAARAAHRRRLARARRAPVPRALPRPRHHRDPRQRPPRRGRARDRRRHDGRARARDGRRAATGASRRAPAGPA